MHATRLNWISIDFIILHMGRTQVYSPLVTDTTRALRGMAWQQRHVHRFVSARLISPFFPNTKRSVKQIDRNAYISKTTMTKTTKRKKQQKMIRKSHLEPKCRGGGGRRWPSNPKTSKYFCNIFFVKCHIDPNIIGSKNNRHKDEVSVIRRPQWQIYVCASSYIHTYICIIGLYMWTRALCIMRK